MQRLLLCSPLLTVLEGLNFFYPKNCKIVLVVLSCVVSDIDIVIVFQNRTLTHEAYADKQLW